jgi:hypothetical protein
MMSYDALVISAHHYGRILGVAYAEIFRSAAPLLVEDPTVFYPVSQG